MPRRALIDLKWLCWLCLTLVACNRNPGVKGDAGGKTTNGERARAASARTTTAPPAGSASAEAVSGSAPCRGLPASAAQRTPHGAPVTLKVNVAGAPCRIAPDFVGSNYEAFPDWGADVSMSAFQATAFREAGMALLRYPGGAPGDWMDLLMTERCKKGEPPNWGAPAYGALWQFAKAAGVQRILLQTNPTPQWCGKGERDASGARAAALAKAALAQGVKAVFEVGNEPDLGDSYFAKHGGRDAYIARFIEHANAIHAAVPGSEVYGPALCGLGGNCTFLAAWDSGWLDAFLAKTGNKSEGPGKGSVDGVSLHVYWHNEWGFSDLKAANIDKYGFAMYWASTVMPHIRRIIAKHDSRELPVVVSEISVGNGVPKDPGQSQNMFTVLGTLDTIGGFATSGVRAFQWFDANAAGPADFWMITRDRARPIFYAFVAWSKMGQLLLNVSSDARHEDLAAYATRRDDGSLQVLMLNKTASEHEVTLAFDGYQAKGKRAELTTLTPTTPRAETSKSITFNGKVDPAPGALPPPISSILENATARHVLPAYSAALLHIGP
jgi:hypothetical protein